jgi:transcriptional regulator with XRE-family HTH domain
MNDTERRRLLGQFVRAHREAMKPEAHAPRRRTPGLRREELAARAGIGTTWCAWIEQGREVKASAEALARLAAALALTRAERAYLFELAGRRDPDLPLTVPAVEAPASMRILVEIVSQPAYGLDRAWNACCWNRAAAQLFDGWLGEGRQKNLLRYVFIEPTARSLIPDWEERSRRLVAEFRADYGRSLGDPRTNAVIDALRRESPAFADAWSVQSVSGREGGLRHFRHPRQGVLCFDQHTFSPAERPDYKLVVLTPVPKGRASSITRTPNARAAR